MLIFTMFLFGFSTIDIITLIKEKNKKDFIVFLIMLIASFAFGVYYYSNEYQSSFAELLFKLFNIKG